MNQRNRRSALPQGANLPKRFDIWHRQSTRTVLRIVFRLFCWSFVAWLVWNHALMNFFNAGRVGIWQSIGIGAILWGLSAFLEDADSRWDHEAPTRASR